MSRSKVWLAAAVAALCAPAGQAVILFDDAFNFRELRGGDVPLSFTTGDNFQIGVSVTDSATGERPEGAIVKAQNTVTSEVVVLNPSGSTNYGTTVPYSAPRASGSWVIEVQSNIGSNSVLLPAFGTGPGTGPVPLVQNLQATGSGTSRGLQWVTPQGVVDQTANDGNIDRLRARLNDARGQLVDDRGLGVGDQASLGETSYQFDSSAFTHNGAYVGQLLVEGFNPFNRSRAYDTFVVDDITGLGGTPVDFDSVFAFRDVRQPNSVRFGEGDQMVIGVNVDPSDDTWVHAEQDGFVVPINQAREADRSFEFSTSVPFDQSLTDPWTFVAFNGSERTTTDSLAFDAPSALPFVRNITITPDNLTPTIAWDLPAGSTAPFDSVQVGLFDDVTDERLSVFGPNGDSLFENLDPTATSYTFQPGQLQFGRQYVTRVVLGSESATGNLENRSLSFFNFSPIPGSPPPGTPPIYLPTLDPTGVFNFDFDVEAATPVTLDPFFAIGYDFEIGEGNPLFTSVLLPEIGDDLFELWLFDELGDVFDPGIQLTAGIVFDFTTLGLLEGVDYSLGAERFRILGIELEAMLDPTDVTAFATTVTFGTAGTFNGTMTPITQFVEPSAVPEPHVVGLALAGLAGFWGRRRRRR